MIRQMKNAMLAVVLFIVLVLGSAMSGIAAETGDISANPHVLFLSSYSYEWESIPLQLKGIQTTLDGYATIDYVFMDTKRTSYDTVKDSVYRDIEQRAVKEAFDYVIAGDDAALTFVLEYQAELFEGVPVVFEGINNQTFAGEAAKNPLITGIVEAFPLKETIELATGLQPKATHIVGICDDTQSGQGSRVQFMRLQSEFPQLSFEIQDCSVMNSEMIGQSVSEYGEETILIFLMMTSDINGSQFSNTEAVEYITGYADIPVYKADELGIGNGIVGGVVVSYEQMAAEAAQMVLEIENGKSAADIPMQTAGYHTMFDKAVLDHFGIETSQVEMLSKSEVSYINNPPGFITEYKSVLIPAALIIFLLLLILFGSGYLLARQRKLSKEMRSKDLMLNSLLDNIPGGVAIYEIPENSPDQIKTVYSSEGTPKLSGRTMDEYQAWIAEDLFGNTVYEEDLAQLQEQILKSIPYGDPINVQYRLKHKDGSLVWVMLSAVLIRKEKGINVYYAVYTDITQQKKLHQAEQKELQAKLANQEKSRFLSTVSHDMRTPLNGILGLTDLMLERNVDEQMNQDLLQLKNSGQYLLALINDTLDISKIERGDLELHPTVCNGKSVYENMIKLMEPLLAEKKIRMRIHRENMSFFWIYTDVGRIEQVIMNVFGNAVKFSEEGGTIDLYIENKSSQDGIIIDQVTIADYGIGMSEEFTPHIFEAFRQEHAGSKTKYQGTGLGMSITKRILDVLGGDIVIESELGRGTKVTFTLPMQEATKQQIKEAVEKTNETVPDQGTLQNKRILLCEDHPLNARIVIRLLESRGCQVIQAENGKEGLLRFAGSTPGYFDMILMDVRMPVMNGLEATRAIRTLEREDAASIPIIATSANAFDEDVRKSMEAGMNAHIAKPIESDQLFRCIAEHIRISG